MSRSLSSDLLSNLVADQLMRQMEPAIIRAGSDIASALPDHRRDAILPTTDQGLIADVIELRTLAARGPDGENLDGAGIGYCRAVWVPLYLAIQQAVAAHISSLDPAMQGDLAWACTNRAHPEKAGAV